MDLSVKGRRAAPDSVVQTVDEILSDCEEAVKKFHDPDPYAMHQVALGSLLPLQRIRRAAARIRKACPKAEGAPSYPSG